jgi:branched-chain amino acid transport system ATP-binding protein
MSLLHLKALTIAYGRTTAVHSLDLTVEQGSIVCLIGANGAGKTTTLRTISGLLRPKSGQIIFAGQEITGLEAHRIAAMGLVQVPEGRQIFAELTVEENLRLGAWLLTDITERARRRDDVLTKFPRLRDRLRQLAGSMSGGEQQMLAIGRALMAAPRLLLLDEPSMGLAPLFVDEIFSLISDLKRAGTTILLVEQNASAALEVADRAYVLESGRVTLQGNASEVAENDEVARSYLGGS